MERRIWSAKVRAIGSSNIFATDISALTALVQCEARLFSLQAQVEKTGPLIKTVDGDVRQNPLVRQLHDERAHALRMWSRFGHTPADRSRIMDSPEDRDDKGILSGQWAKPQKAEQMEVVH
jgi:P27 family predicted phage terminase small subunit